MSAVLVTGASGFLGRAVVERMVTAGHTVIGLDPVAGQPPGGFTAILPKNWGRR